MDQKGNQFSTFAGVFTPSILTILGVIMFLRAGYVVGQAGIVNTILILCAAEAISLLTAISMSAIATNTPVAGGGAYFLISRALGPQFGFIPGPGPVCALLYSGLHELARSQFSEPQRVVCPDISWHGGNSLYR